MTQDCSKNYRIYQKIWWLLTRVDRQTILLLLILMFLTMVFETLGVGLMVPVITLFATTDIEAKYPMVQWIFDALGQPAKEVIIIGAMIGLVLVFIVKNSLLAYSAWRQTRFAVGIDVDLSQRLFALYLHQPYTFHLQRNSAQLIRNVTNEVSLFSKVVMSAMTLLTEMLVVLGLFLLLFLVEPIGALVVTLTLGTAAWTFHRFTREQIALWGAARQHHEGFRIQHLQEGLGGAKDVRVLGREMEFLDQYRFHNKRSANVRKLQTFLTQVPRLWLELLAVSGLAILVCSMVIQNNTLEVVLPTLALFAAAAFRIMPSVGRILNALQALRYIRPVVETLYTEFAMQFTIPQSSRNRVPFQTAVELRRISYTYTGSAKPTLCDISFSVKRGEFVGVVGSSGAGKSTLVDVMLGLLPPDSGEVIVDGQSVFADIRSWQNQIGYVPQAIFLTDDSLRRNIAFGVPSDQIDEDAVCHAVRSAQLAELVKGLPEGLDTVVGERGIRLSGGQRQRIGIARALYHNPAILVLDEATSALDNTTERGVMDAVCALRGDKTIFVVAHRLSTVQYCDRIFCIERGSIIDEVRSVAALGRLGVALPEANNE